MSSGSIILVNYNYATCASHIFRHYVISRESDIIYIGEGQSSQGPSEKYFAMYQNPRDFYSDKKIDPWKKGRF
jgi:hypothetical protein